ncbi:MAG: glutamate mutase L [Oscillospiraceae bacterium]|jgi:uncharacterized protein (TIGR01319 family)|nr:glutamate mutase L [Oscillospiraceae bacterium]
MPNIRVFVDFGSTFTKVAAFDLDEETLLARVQSPSTVDTDVTVGLRRALDELRRVAPADGNAIRSAEACSSAAGGLRLAVIGLVPDYTTKAGYLAALGAGAKVVSSFSYEMSRSEVRQLEDSRPDIVLLTGGTDGGNKRAIVHNAAALAASSVRSIIVAGNKSARDDIEDALSGAGKLVTYAPNVMPEFGRLELDPVNERIREMFISRITDAKGISRVSGIIAGVLMPTPAAVLEAAKLIADGAPPAEQVRRGRGGHPAESGLGELLLVDVGGATTDVYSIARGDPRDGVHLLGLREPYAKRTVEGDLGLFHNLDTLAAITSDKMPIDERADFERGVEKLRAVLSVPRGETPEKYQLALTREAVRTAVYRHAGRVEPVRTSDGEVWIQRGKDLSGVGLVIGAGGPLSFSRDPLSALEGAAADSAAPDVLAPRAPAYMLDDRYILFAIGLLARSEPEKALRIAKKYLVGLGGAATSI